MALLLPAVLSAWLLLHRSADAASTAGTAAQTCALATERAVLAQEVRACATRIRFLLISPWYTPKTVCAQALRTHFWNETSGLWDEALWWQNACSLEVMSHHALLAGVSHGSLAQPFLIPNSYAVVAQATARSRPVSRAISPTCLARRAICPEVARR